MRFCRGEAQETAEDKKSARLSRRNFSRECVWARNRKPCIGVPERLQWERSRQFPASDGTNRRWSGRRWRRCSGSSDRRPTSRSTHQVPIEVLRLFRPLGETLPCCLSRERVEWRLIMRNSAIMLDWSCNWRVLHTRGVVLATGSRTFNANTPDSTQWVEEQDRRLPKLEDGQGRIKEFATRGVWEDCGLLPTSAES